MTTSAHKIIPIPDRPDDDSLAWALEQEIVSPDDDMDARGLTFVSTLSHYLLSEAMDRGETDITICDVFVRPDRRFFEAHPSCPVRYMGEDESDLLLPESHEVFEKMLGYADKAWEALFSMQPAGQYIKTVSGTFDLYVLAGGERQSPGIAQWMEYRKLYISMVAPSIFRIWPDYMTARGYMRDVSLADLVEMSSPVGFVVNNVEVHILPRALRDRISYYLTHVAMMSGSDLFHSDEARELQLPPPQGAVDYHGLIINGLRSISACRLI